MRIGMRVLVPFGSRSIKGYIIDFSDAPKIEISKIKPINEILTDEVAIESHLIALAGWMKKYYGGTINQALKTVLPVKTKVTEKKQRTVYLNETEDKLKLKLQEFEKKRATARIRFLKRLIEKNPADLDELKKELNLTSGTVNYFIEEGLISVREKALYRNPLPKTMPLEYKQRPTLNKGQKEAVDKFIDDYKNNKRGTYLIHGVTGSGKTEVYMDMIEYVLGCGRQVIVLIPEIALTYQTVMRFYARFKDKVSILNSKMSAGERYDQFMRAKNGDISVMIGPRSALFAPFSNLGLIVIDEEHETSYKSENMPRYHARQTAIARASMMHASVVLGSATPSLESYYRAKRGIYTLLTLPNRAMGQNMAKTHIVDMRSELKAGNRSIFSAKLVEYMKDRLEKKEQIMLFLNRRGIAGFVSCRSCGEIIKCPHCDVSLSQHLKGKLICHYCGYETQMPDKCPTCLSPYIGGFKAGTQKIQLEVKKLFPNAMTLRMDADTTRKKGSYEAILEAFSSHRADILIGTQMIVKGHDFENVTLVGILAADLSLGISDFQSGERTFQLLCQAAGRAGRGTKEGDVIIQTYQPENYCIVDASKQDYVSFYENEIGYRLLMDYPPISNLLYIPISSRNEDAAEDAADIIKGYIENMKIEGLKIIGPSSAPIAKVKDTYRKVLYMKNPDYKVLVNVKDHLERFIKDNISFQQVVVQYDFNPNSF